MTPFDYEENGSDRLELEVMLTQMVLHSTDYSY
jgi:hypothetical protein